MDAGSICSILTRCTDTRHINQCFARLVISGDLSSSVFYHNNLIRAHTRVIFSPSSSLLNQVIALFSHLLHSGLSPDLHTFPPLIKACSLTPSSPLRGFSAHACAVKFGLASHLFVNNALIHFHSCAGDVDGARSLLDSPNQQLDSVSYNSMISGYVRVGDLVSARKVFDDMPIRDEISWSAMIAGYVQCGFSKDGLMIFNRMQEQSGLEPGESTLVSVLSACAHLGELEQGKWVHGYLKKKNRSGIIGRNVYLGTCLIDMYCKCGEVDLGMEVFDRMIDKNLLAWTSMVKGLAMHGRGVEALRLFGEMEKTSGLIPDDVAFLSILSACTHTGLVDDGRRIFKSMTTVYGVVPKLEHYGCMVDLMARNGLLNDAMKLVESMPMAADSLIWGAIMAGCRFHGDVGLAEVAVKHLNRLEPNNSGVYVLLANIYAASGRYQDARNVRILMKAKGVEKTPGCSSVELDGTVHEFLAGDTSHSQMGQILEKWEEMERLIRVEGYIPAKKEVLLDVDDEEKEVLLSRHSEKLAIAFLLLNTSPQTTIRVVKNLRVCGDCHVVTKLISKVYDRRIVVRDRTRFHQFENGNCTCNDYW